MKSFRSRFFCLTIFFAMLIITGPAMAADAAAGKTKSAICMACHGVEGVSVNPLWPDLAGQKDMYLVKQMKDFRDGKRKLPVMAPMAKGLSDDDIADLAAYYSSLQ